MFRLPEFFRGEAGAGDQRAGELGGVFDAADETQAQTFVEKYLRGELK